MQSLSEHIEQHQSDAIVFLQSLVRIATVNPPGERYAECVGALDARLQSLGLKTQVVRVPDEVVAKTLPDSAGHARYNLIGRWDVGARKTLHFNAHYDVVPVSGEWKHGSPFNPVVADGWIYGRGSGDMKGSMRRCAPRCKPSKIAAPRRKSTSRSRSPVTKRLAASWARAISCGTDSSSPTSRLSARVAARTTSATGTTACCGFA